ncbi:MAG TPA: hypothetical protein VNV88_14015, partial [Candidatus Solibacter sp.]|nr:hypothetical protein [Candidatus Solibacter sp.]
MRKLFFAMVLLGLCYMAVRAQEKASFSPVTKNFISVDLPVVVLEHVRVIDGTGAAAVTDQTVVIEKGMIREIGKSASVSIPAGARVMDLT